MTLRRTGPTGVPVCDFRRFFFLAVVCFVSLSAMTLTLSLTPSSSSVVSPQLLRILLLLNLLLLPPPCLAGVLVDWNGAASTVVRPPTLAVRVRRIECNRVALFELKLASEEIEKKSTIHPMTSSLSMNFALWVFACFGLVALADGARKDGQFLFISDTVWSAEISQNWTDNYIQDTYDVSDYAFIKIPSPTNAYRGDIEKYQLFPDSTILICDDEVTYTSRHVTYSVSLEELPPQKYIPPEYIYLFTFLL